MLDPYEPGGACLVPLTVVITPVACRRSNRNQQKSPPSQGRWAPWFHPGSPPKCDRKDSCMPLSPADGAAYLPHRPGMPWLRWRLGPGSEGVFNALVVREFQPCSRSLFTRGRGYSSSSSPGYSLDRSIPAAFIAPKPVRTGRSLDEAASWSASSRIADEWGWWAVLDLNQ